MAEDLQGKAADLVKKVLTVGVGAIFLTEESVRGLVSEFKLPKELLKAVLESAAKTKNDFIENISQEVIDQILQKVEPEKLVQEILEKNEFELHIKVSAKPKHVSKA